MSKPLPPSRTAPQFVVRFPDEAMRDRIKLLADESGRSMNAEIVHILQSFLDQLDADVGHLVDAMERRTALPEGVHDNSTKTSLALVKVLRFEERVILMDRVNRLGGTENVLSIPTNEVKTKLAGPAIERTPEEAKSYFSKTVAQMPLTAILTTEEINAIAARMVQVQQATQLVAMKRTVPPPDQVKPDSARAPEIPEPAVRSDPTAMTKGFLAEPKPKPRPNPPRPRPKK